MIGLLVVTIVTNPDETLLGYYNSDTTVSSDNDKTEKSHSEIHRLGHSIY